MIGVCISRFWFSFRMRYKYNFWRHSVYNRKDSLFNSMKSPDSLVICAGISPVVVFLNIELIMSTTSQDTALSKSWMSKFFLLLDTFTNKCFPFCPFWVRYNHHFFLLLRLNQFSDFELELNIRWYGRCCFSLIPCDDCQIANPWYCY